MKHYSYRTEETYAQWIRRCILLHGKRHPSEMGGGEVNAFFTHLAIEQNVAASNQKFAPLRCGNPAPMAGGGAP